MEKATPLPYNLHLYKNLLYMRQRPKCETKIVKLEENKRIALRLGVHKDFPTENQNTSYKRKSYN